MTLLPAPSERRSLVLCAVGALAGLVVAGAGLFTAHGTRIAGVPPEDVALVNQVPILMSDFDAQLRAIDNVGLDHATPQQKRQILSEMIREELYVQRGIELGVQADVIEVRQALVGAVEAQQAIDANAAQPDEAALHAWYARNRARYAGEGTLELADLIAPSQAQAGAAVAALRAGKPAQGVHSSSKVDDGQEFYFAAQLHLGDRLFAVAQGLRAGQVSDPVAMPDGWHILVVRSNQPPVPPAYEQVRDRVLADVRADKVARMQAGADAFLRRRADIQIAPGFE